MDELNFCKTNDYCNKIERILEIPFDLKKVSLEKQYQVFFDTYSDSKINREYFVPKTEDMFFLEAFKNQDEYVIGIDLPVLISLSNPIGTIFILGEDPLREHAIRSGDHKDILLATPYAVHLEKYKKENEKFSWKGRQKIYWDISELIFSLNYNVYYTDINKIWIKSNKPNSKKLDMPFDLSSKFSNCLLEERKVFNPDLIITFGKKAENAINNIEEDKKLTLVHPSFSGRNGWKKKLNARPTDFAILEYIKEKLKFKLQIK